MLWILPNHIPKRTLPVYSRFPPRNNDLSSVACISPAIPYDTQPSFLPAVCTFQVQDSAILLWLTAPSALWSGPPCLLQRWWPRSTTRESPGSFRDSGKAADNTLCSARTSEWRENRGFPRESAGNRRTKGRWRRCSRSGCWRSTCSECLVMRNGMQEGTGVFILIVGVFFIACFVKFGAGRELSVLAMYSDRNDESLLHEIELR